MLSLPALSNVVSPNRLSESSPIQVVRSPNETLTCVNNLVFQTSLEVGSSDGIFSFIKKLQSFRRSRLRKKVNSIVSMATRSAIGPGLESAIRVMMYGDMGEEGEPTYDQDELGRVLSIIRKKNGEVIEKVKPKTCQIARGSTAEDCPRLNDLEEEQSRRKEGEGRGERGREQRGDGGIDHIKACETGTKWRQGQQRPMKEKISTERTSEETAMFVEMFLAKLDVAADADADLNRASRPAIEKLKMLPELQKVLAKRQLQNEFLDRGVLSSLKNWLEPLPDGSLPNIHIRSALLKLFTDLPIHVEVLERSEQLKKSCLGKVVMFYSRLPEETLANKKLARDLVFKWSCPIVEKRTQYEVKKHVPKPRVEDQRSRINKKLQLLRRKKSTQNLQAVRLSVHGR